MLLLRVIWAVVRALFSKKADLVAENLALRQQLIVLGRKTKRPRLLQRGRVFWLWLARSWTRWRDGLIIFFAFQGATQGLQRPRSVAMSLQFTSRLD